ncbi:MAG TPA: twin-arginine translocase subunit TatC [Verrucomicrobiota bacterium]|nr:twin-arginine translocase subunit TatC [Verrucomicrobiota bacterium]
MATEPEDPILDSEDEGGPIKGFLEHLEDLRWVLLKSITALFVALLVCLFGAPFLIGILKYPLERSGKLGSLYGSKDVSIAVRVGTNSVGSFKPGVEYLKSLETALNVNSNQSFVIDLKPIVHGTNNYLGFTVSTNKADFPEKAPVELLNLSPISGFMAALQVAFYGGLVFSAPFILFFIAQFVLPALKVNELRYVRKAFIFSIGLFVLGVSLCYFVMLPIALRAAVWFSNQMGFGAFQWTADTYIGFVTKFMLAMGIGFELPVFLLLFVKLGFISYSTLAKNRKIVFVVILLIATVLTPPDAVTQISMTIPLYALFELTALIAWWWERKDKKLAEAQEAAEEAEREAQRRRRNERVAAEAAEAEKRKAEGAALTPAVVLKTDSDSAERSEKERGEVSPQDGESAKEDDTLQVEQEEFVPEGEPEPPYVPPLPDAGYQPYLEALENSKSSADSETETSEADSPEEEKTGKETQQKKFDQIADSERNPDIPL